jgi:hypothetical protein
MVVMVVLIFVVPSIWMYLSRMKSEKQFKKKLFNFAESMNSTISELDFWKKSAIGIDKTLHKLFYIRITNSEEYKKEIDLTEIQKCRVLNASRSMNNRNGNFTAIDKLELIFTYRDKNKSEIALEFYNPIHDSLSLAGEVQLIEKWLRIVDAELSHKS